MQKTVDQEEFVIVDVETTGLSPRNGDRVVEIAALKVKNFEPREEFHSLINPQREISYGAFCVNGISRDMLEDAPQAEEILPSFLEFIDGACLVGHNIFFDLGFLCEELNLAGLCLCKSTKSLDTIKMARHLLPHLPRYSLQSVVYGLNICAVQEHRAMGDCRLTFSIFHKLAVVAQEQNILHLDHFLRLFGAASRRSSRARRGILR